MKMTVSEARAKAIYEWAKEKSPSEIASILVTVSSRDTLRQISFNEGLEQRARAIKRQNK